MNKYFTHNGQDEKGPFTINQLKKQKISKETMIWFEGLKNWTKAGEIAELKDLFVPKPPPFRQEQTNSNIKLNYSQIPNLAINQQSDLFKTVWICPNCNSEVDGSLGICFNCGSDHEGYIHEEIIDDIKELQEGKTKNSKVTLAIIGAILGIPLSYYFQPELVRSKVGSLGGYLNHFGEIVDNSDLNGNILLSVLFFGFMGGLIGYFIDKNENRTPK